MTDGGHDVMKRVSKKNTIKLNEENLNNFEAMSDQDHNEFKTPYSKTSLK